MNKIEEAWRSYAEQVLPGDCPEVQRQAMKMAYYAGASRGGSLVASDQMSYSELATAIREHVRQCQAGEL